jgi:GAF domain-containing protein
VDDEHIGTFRRFGLRELGILGPGPDREFDTAVCLSARSLRAPMASIGVLDFDAGLTRIRAHVGMGADMPEVDAIPLETSIALSAMSETDVIAIPDTARDSVAQKNPLVRTQGIKSILAAPVLCPAREVVALVAVHDRVPRLWSPEEKDAVLGIAHFCTQVILLRAALRTLGMVSRRAKGGA